MKRVLAAVWCLLSSAVHCAEMPTDAEYGFPPEDVRAVISSHLRAHLKDPYSAQVDSIRGPGKVYVRNGLLVPNSWGWGICFNLNAKNSYGGYTGAHVYTLLYRSGTVIQWAQNDTDNQATNERISRLCEQITEASSSPVPSSVAPPAVTSPPTGADVSNAPVVAAHPSGKDAFQAEHLPAAKACSSQPRAVLSAKGAGFETYMVACSNGDTLAVRCEFGNCRALR